MQPFCWILFVDWGSEEWQRVAPGPVTAARHWGGSTTVTHTHTHTHTHTLSHSTAYLGEETVSAVMWTRTHTYIQAYTSIHILTTPFHPHLLIKMIFLGFTHTNIPEYTGGLAIWRLDSSWRQKKKINPPPHTHSHSQRSSDPRNPAYLMRKTPALHHICSSLSLSA